MDGFARICLLLFDSVQFPICIHISVTGAWDNKTQIKNFLSMAYVRRREVSDAENDKKVGQALQISHSSSCVGRVETYDNEWQDTKIPNDVRCATLGKLHSHSSLGRVEKQALREQKASNNLKTKCTAMVSPHPLSILGFLAIFTNEAKCTDA